MILGTRDPEGNGKDHGFGRCRVFNDCWEPDAYVLRLSGWTFPNKHESMSLGSTA